MSRRVLALLGLVLVSAGCAGRDFTRPPLDSVAVGKATEAEIRQKFGTPYREGAVMKNNETMNYLYQQTRGTAFDLKIYQQILVIQYDNAAVVKEVEYTATGER